MKSQMLIRSLPQQGHYGLREPNDPQMARQHWRVQGPLAQEDDVDGSRLKHAEARIKVEASRGGRLHAIYPESAVWVGGSSTKSGGGAEEHLAARTRISWRGGMG